MPFVVTENCINCRYTDCVEVCPVDCFHVGPNFIVIDPEECIDCALCEPECPAHAIYPEESLPEKFKHFIDINSKYSKIWPGLTQHQENLPDAKNWDGKPDKLPLLKTYPESET